MLCIFSSEFHCASLTHCDLDYCSRLLSLPVYKIGPHMFAIYVIRPPGATTVVYRFALPHMNLFPQLLSACVYSLVVDAINPI